MDPGNLNKSILRQHYSIPTMVEVLGTLVGKKIFMVLENGKNFRQGVVPTVYIKHTMGQILIQTPAIWH